MQLDLSSPNREPELLKSYIDDFQGSLSDQHYASGLTGSGYPLEVSFTNQSEQPRYTIDPYCLSLPADKRLQATIGLVKRDFQIDIGRERLKWLKTLQPRSPNYGAWLGLREKLGKITAKFYIEVDPSREQEHWPEFSSLQPYDRCLTMLGYTPNLDSQKPGGYELYYRSRNIHPLLFPSLLSPINAVEYADKLQSEIENIHGRKLKDRLPGGSTGFSYAIDSTGKATSLTLFIFCRSLFGRDRQTRFRFEQLIKSQGLRADNYLKLTESSLTNLSVNTQHGISAITISSQGEIVHGVGFCPAQRRDNDC
ncbi:MAG: hypothetical protein JKX81_17055 [Arenicella sp.]|nr:hypothetical protein [Arenicella sp.]